MIKKTAKVNISSQYKCPLCVRQVKKGEQFLSHTPQWGRNLNIHVSCVMELCGEEVKPGMTWLNDKEKTVVIEKEKTKNFMEKAKELIKEGKSLLDVDV